MDTTVTRMDTEQRLIDLETKVAHQDRSLLELSEELYQQQQQITLLEERCRKLVEQLESVVAASPSANPDDEVPPHY